MALATVGRDWTRAELTPPFDLHPNQIQEWKKRLVKGAEGVFGEASGLEGEEREAEKLHAKIGQLTMENDFLSKALGRNR